VKRELVVKVEPGLKPSPNPELNLDVLDDDEEEEEMEDENLDEGGYLDDKEKIKFEPLQEYY